MKLDRWLGLLSQLQQKKKVTTVELAQLFEVSTRTILRDVQGICEAGIPLVTVQGQGGGISIAPGYSLNTTVFTQEELTAIFTGLKAFDSVSSMKNEAGLVSKFGGNVGTLADSVMIDLSSFYKDSLAQKIEMSKKAIRDRCCISFRYYYNKGEANKLIEPYLIVFKWSDWYVFGFCRERQDFRLYKLRRLWKLCATEEYYTPRDIPEEKRQFGGNITDDYYITAIYEPSEKYKLVEEYGPDSFTVLEDGRLWTKWGFTDPERAIGWFLGFGDKVQVIDPPEMVEKIKAAVENIRKKYT